GQSLMVTVTGQYDALTAGDRAGWAEDTELAATGPSRCRLAATGLGGGGASAARQAGGGEWTDEVFAAGPAGQADLEGGARGGAVLTGAGQTARAAAKGSGPGHTRASHTDPGHAAPGHGRPRQHGSASAGA